MIEFVSYTGAYPNLCRGILTVKVDGKQYRFGHSWLDALTGQKVEGDDLLDPFWKSGGSCGFDDEWNEEVSKGQWELLDYDLKREEYPEEIRDKLEDILEVMNQNVTGGCCGGCL